MKSHNSQPIRIALAGMGKMGLSHLAIVNAHPDLQLVAVCDPARYLRDIMAKYTGVQTYADYELMLSRERPDAVLIATPSIHHTRMTRQALERDMHVFCEKPFSLDVQEGARLVALAEERGLVTQVGYHNRFVATFQEAQRLLKGGAIGRIYHAKVECYGPVMVRQKGSTWRTSKSEGGGCLYDYACHGIDLLGFILGPPASVSGSMLRSVFSSGTDDEVYANLGYADGATAQVSANWSDDSYRKMSTTVTLWGLNGKIEASRQELSVYLRAACPSEPQLQPGWNKQYTTELTKPVWFYLRGEEYSSQIDFFAESIREGRLQTQCDFRCAHATDIVAEMIREQAGCGEMQQGAALAGPPPLRGDRAQRAPWRELGVSILRSPSAIANALKRS